MNIEIDQKIKGHFKVTKIEGQETASDYVRFTQIPTEIEQSLDLSPNEKHVFGVIYTFNTNNKPFFGSNKFIAASVGLKNPDSIKSILSSLEEKKLIARFYENGKPINGRKGIQITWVPSHSSMLPLAFSNATPLAFSNDHTNKENINKFTREFEEFWKTYPRKVERKRAFKAYSSTRNSFSSQAIVSGLSKYIAFWKAEKTLEKYIPHASTWLNDERFLDELKPESVTKLPDFI